jgi:MerR family Zn(II)-responsive transcriptional regulator of zntA
MGKAAKHLRQRTREEEDMQIGELARQAGVSVRAIRYYEELGLMRPEKRSRGGFRLYGPKNHARLIVINFLKELGLSLMEIREILLAKQPSGGNLSTVRFLIGIFGAKSKMVESRIESLQSMKTELDKALRILHVCENCGREILLDASSCGDCASLRPAESVPDTLRVLLH